MTSTFRTSRIVSALDPARPHVVLVGLPGAGKSTVGQGLAEALNRSFLDLDAEIERREGATLPQLFAEKGEPYFRQCERALTEELRLIGNMVLAPGGGWIMDGESVSMLRPPARIIYLKVTPEIALKRLGSEVGTRPLLNRPDPIGELRRLLGQREEAYLTADYAINTDVMKPQAVVEAIAKLAVTF